MKNIFIAILCSIAAVPSFAQVTVTDPWIRATAPHQPSTGAFMQLTAKQDARFVAAQSPVASIVEIHEMRMENQVMKMRAVPGIELPSGKTVELKPGSYHIMLTGLKQQVREGERIPLSLIIEQGSKRETIELTVPVRPLNAAVTHGHAKH